MKEYRINSCHLFSGISLNKNCREFLHFSAGILFFTLLPSVAIAANVKWARDMVRQCDRGFIEECINLGIAFSRGEYQGYKIKKNPQEAKQLFNQAVRLGEKGCEAGQADPCYKLGVLYFEGQIIEADMVKGVEYVRRACNLRHSEACSWLDNSGLR